MRYLSALLLLLPFATNAQTIYPPTGSKVGINRFAGFLQIDSGLVIAKVDTSDWFGRKSDFVRMASNNKLYYFNGVKYVEMGTATSGGADSSTYVTQYQLDTAKTNIYGEINERVKYTDTASMLQYYLTDADGQDYLLVVDTAAMLSYYINSADTAAMLAAYQAAINSKLNIADTGAMMGPYQTAINNRVKYADTAGMLSAYQSAINSKLNVSDTATMLQHYFNRNRVLSFGVTGSGNDLNTLLPNGGYITSLSTASWATNAPSWANLGGFISFKRTGGSSGLEFYYNDGYGGNPHRFGFRTLDAQGYNTWLEIATREWVTAQNYLTSYTETDPVYTANGVKYADTASMLQWYLTDADGATYVTYTDTAGMLQYYVSNGDTTAMLQYYISSGDTATMLNYYLTDADAALYELLSNKAQNLNSPNTTTYPSTQAVVDYVGNAVNDYIPLAEKGAANGVATLDANGKLPNSQVPAIAIVNTYVVASQAAMLALAAEQGDVAIRTDLSKSFILASEPASTIGNWQELLSPTAPSTNLSLGTTTGTTQVINNSNGTGVTLPAATTTLAGLQSAADKTKLNGIAAGAEVNVQSDWNAASGDAFILNKPTALPPSGTAGGDLSGSYPNPQVVDDSHNHIIGNVDGLQGALDGKEPTITTLPVSKGGTGVGTLTGYVKGNGTSAFTASATIPYTDITGTPTIPTVNDATITVSGSNGITGGGSFSLNQVTNSTLTLAPTFGTAVNTFAQGNDSRINNGQTAFSWGNHATAGYELQSNKVTTLTGANNTTYPTSLAVSSAITAATHSPVTIGTANGLSLAGQALSLGLASSTENGALSAANWNTFNNKQNALGTSTGGKYLYQDQTWKQIAYSELSGTPTIPTATDYVTTNTTQTGLSGNKTWIGQHSFANGGIVIGTEVGSASHDFTINKWQTGAPYDDLTAATLSPAFPTRSLTYAFAGTGNFPFSPGYNHVQTIIPWTGSTGNWQLIYPYTNSSNGKIMYRNGSGTAWNTPYTFASEEWVTAQGYTSNTGTVTSIAMSVPTGLTISGSPITSSGTLALGYATGYQGYTTVEANKLAGIEAGANNYVLPTATATTLGGVELASNTVQSVAANAVSSTAARTYGIQLNAAGQAVVNVPWTDNNTTYTGSTSISLTGGSFQRAALTGDVIASANSNATTIAANSVTNSKAADMAAMTIKGNNTGSTADPKDLTVAEVKTMLEVASGTYTPTTVGAITTIGGAVTYEGFMYQRIGDIVTVNGYLSFENETLPGPVLGFTLPIASDFETAYDLTGVVTMANGEPSRVVSVKSDAANNCYSITFTGLGTSVEYGVYVQFKYIIQ